MLTYNNGSYFRASGTRGAFEGLSNALVAEGFPGIPVNDGDRETGEQEAGFRLRYRPATSATDRGPFGDRVYWPGHGYWVRIMAGGVMAPPGGSNHEKRRSGDLGYPYNSNTAAHRRAQQLASQFGITWEGKNFSTVEWWHWTYWGPLGTVGSTAGSGSTTFDPNGDDELDATEKLQLSRVHDALVNTQGTFYYKPDAIINILRDEIKTVVDAIRKGDVYYPGTNWNAYQTLANVSREDKATLEAILARPAGGGGVDVDALAAQIRDGLGAEVAAELAKRLAS